MIIHEIWKYEASFPDQYAWLMNWNPKYESGGKERRERENWGWGVPYRFQRSRWDLEGRERQRRSISTQRDWIWVRSLLMDADSSGVCDSKLPPLEYSRRSSRSSASRVLNCSFFAFWYISDSVLPPPPPSNGAAADDDSISNRHQQREGEMLRMVVCFDGIWTLRLYRSDS